MKTKASWWFLLGSSAPCLLRALPDALRGHLAEALGYMTGFALLPFFVAFIARARKGDWDGFSKWFFFGLLICAGLTAPQQAMDWRHWSADRMKKHMGEIVRNAQAGHSDSAVSDSTPFDDAIRVSLADIAGAGKTYEKAVASIDSSDIYTTKSFASRDSMQQALTHAQALAAADRDFYVFWMSEPHAVEQRLSQSPMSESDRRGFMVGFRKSQGNSPMGKLLIARCGLSASVISLYSFAVTHSSEFHISGQRLVIDPGVFHEFKQKQEASVKLQEAVKALASYVKRMQQDLGKEYGVKVQ